MRFGHLELPVCDPLASMAFYVDVLGFELVANQGDRFIWVKAGAVEILLKPGPGQAAGPFPSESSVTLYTDDLRPRAAALRARGVDLTEDRDCLFFQDPDGHWLQVVDPRSHS